MGCAASKPQDIVGGVATSHEAGKEDAGSAGTVKPQEQTPSAAADETLAMHLKQLEDFIRTFDEMLTRGDRMIGNASGVMSATGKVVDVIGEAIPVFGGPLRAVTKVLRTLEDGEELAGDMIDASRRR